MNQIRTWILAIAMTSAIGCVAYDDYGYRHRGAGYNDASISAAVQSQLDSQGFRNVDVETVRGTVYLEGVVRDSEARRQAGRIASRTYGVEQVVNNVELRGYRTGDAPEDWERRRYEHRNRYEPPLYRGGH